jgi:hypothetical protein
VTSAPPTNITKLPRGHEFASTKFQLSADRVRAYLDAIGDESDYGGSVPPLAAVALGLDALQAEIALPEGSLHTGQEVEHVSVLSVGTPLGLTGRVAQRSERQGYAICVLEFEIAGPGGPGVRARTTIMAPLTEGGAP